MSHRSGKWINPANLITFARILLIFPTAYGIIRGQTLLSIGGFGLIIVSDVLDGVLARRLETPNRFGTLIDHGADAIVVVSLSFIFSRMNLCPVLLPAAIALAFSHYALDATRINARTPRPSALGKINGIAYFVFCAVCLLFTLGQETLTKETADTTALVINIFSWILIASSFASIGQRFTLNKN